MPTSLLIANTNTRVIPSHFNSLVLLNSEMWNFVRYATHRSWLEFTGVGAHCGTGARAHISYLSWRLWLVKMMGCLADSDTSSAGWRIWCMQLCIWNEGPVLLLFAPPCQIKERRGQMKERGGDGGGGSEMWGSREVLHLTTLRGLKSAGPRGCSDL